MQNESRDDIAFVKCGIVDKLALKSACQKVVMAGTRTFRIPYQAPHPYLDWAYKHLLSLTWDMYYNRYLARKKWSQTSL